MLRDEISNEEPQIDFYPYSIEAGFRQTKLFQTQRQKANSMHFSRDSHVRYQQPDLEQISHYAESSNAYLQNIANRTSLNFKKVQHIDNTLSEIQNKSDQIKSVQTDLRKIINQDTHFKQKDTKRTSHPSQLPYVGGLGSYPIPSRKLSLSSSNGFQQIDSFKRTNINTSLNRKSQVRQLSNHSQQNPFKPQDNNQSQYYSDLSFQGFQVKKNSDLNIDSNRKLNTTDQTKSFNNQNKQHATTLNVTAKNEQLRVSQDKSWERSKPRYIDALNSQVLLNQENTDLSQRKINKKNKGFEEEILLSAFKGETPISQLGSIVTQREFDQETQLVLSIDSKNNTSPQNYEKKEVTNFSNSINRSNDQQLIKNLRANRSRDVPLREINLVKVMGYIHEMSLLNELMAESEKTKNIHQLIQSKEFIRSIVNACEKILTNEGEHCIVELEKLFKEGKSKRIVKQLLIFQRISIVCVAQNLLSSEVFEANYKFIKGIISYANSSFLILISIIRNKMKVPPSTSSTASSNQQFLNSDNISQLTSSTTYSTVFSNMYSKSIRKESNIFKKSDKSDSPIQQMSHDNIDYQDNNTVFHIKKQTLMAEKKETNAPNKNIEKQKWVLSLLNEIRQNNELQQRSFKNLSRNDKDFYSFISNYLKQIDKPSSASKHIRHMLEHMSLYFTIKIQQSQQQIEPPIFTLIPSLVISPAPFINIPSSRMYTLFLDLDETLIHCPEAQLPMSTHVSQFLVRPYVQTFLEQLSYFYEIVVFTAGMPDYANWIIDTFDQEHFISHRLYRQHTTRIGDSFVKDLSKSGRDLSKSIIVDNLAQNFALQNNNGIFIRDWTGDPSDTALADLLPLLKEIASSNSSDVREALKQLKEQIQKNIQSGVEFPHLNLKLSK